jgi:hypothetical protein
MALEFDWAAQESSFEPIADSFKESKAGFVRPDVGPI